MHVLGAGAIGLLHGFYSRSTLFLVRPSRAHPTSCNQILTVQTLLPGNQEISKSVQVKPAAGLEVGEIKSLLITTKANDVVSAFKSVEYSLDRNASVVILCNGALGVIDEMKKYLLDRSATLNVNLYSGFTTHGAMRSSQWRVKHTGMGCTKIGGVGNVKETCQDLEMTMMDWAKPLDATWIPNSSLTRSLVMKLAVNCCINPLATLYNCPNGDLLKIDKAMAQMSEICNEISLVFPNASLKSQDLYENVCNIAFATAKNRNSMLVDVENNRKTEIDYLTGTSQLVALIICIIRTCSNKIKRDGHQDTSQHRDLPTNSKSNQEK